MFPLPEELWLDPALKHCLEILGLRLKPWEGQSRNAMLTSLFENRLCPSFNHLAVYLSGR